jgi:hypothetical protein
MDQGSITNRGPDGIEALDDIAKVFGVPVKRARVMLAGDRHSLAGSEHFIGDDRSNYLQIKI